MIPDPMEENNDNEGTMSAVADCLSLLRECLEIFSARQRRAKAEEELHREEMLLREEQYPCDEYAEELFYDEDFRFEWL